MAPTAWAVTPPLTVPQGGTGQSSFPEGAVIVGDSQLRLFATSSLSYLGTSTSILRVGKHSNGSDGIIRADEFQGLESSEIAMSLLTEVGESAVILESQRDDNSYISLFAGQLANVSQIHVNQLFDGNIDLVPQEYVRLPSNTYLALGTNSLSGIGATIGYEMPGETLQIVTNDFDIRWGVNGSLNGYNGGNLLGVTGKLEVIDLGTEVFTINDTVSGVVFQVDTDPALTTISTPLIVNNTATATKLNLTDNSNQIVLNSDGVSGTLSWAPSVSNKTATFPNATGNVVLDTIDNTFTSSQTFNGTSSIIFGNDATWHINAPSTDEMYIGYNGGTGRTLYIQTDSNGGTLDMSADYINIRANTQTTIFGAALEIQPPLTLLDTTTGNPSYFSVSNIDAGEAFAVDTDYADEMSVRSVDLYVKDQYATTTLAVTSGGSGVGGELILEDIDGAGCTRVTALNGVLTAAIVTCP